MEKLYKGQVIRVEKIKQHGEYYYLLKEKVMKKYGVDPKAPGWDIFNLKVYIKTYRFFDSEEQEELEFCNGDYLNGLLVEQTVPLQCKENKVIWPSQMDTNRSRSDFKDINCLIECDEDECPQEQIKQHPPNAGKPRMFRVNDKVRKVHDLRGLLIKVW